MNPHASLVPWGHLLGVVALETALIVGMALLLQRFIRAASWQRTLWQATSLGLLLLVVAEISGAARLVPAWRLREVQSSQAQEEIVIPPAFIEAPAFEVPVPAGFEERAVVVPTMVNDLAPSISWWPGWIWLAGFGVIATWRMLARFGFLLGVRRRLVTDEAVLCRMNSLVRRMSLNGRVKLTETPGLAGPIAFGIICPGISLPPGFTTRFTEAQQETMLAHELAHLAAHDPFWHRLADLISALLWWHPLAWLARRQLHAASEGAADEASLLVKNGPVVLAGCLIELGRELTRPRLIGGLGIGGTHFKSNLGRRVNRLFSLDEGSWRPVRRSKIWLARMIAPVAMVGFTLFATSSLQPQPAGAETLRQVFQRSVVGLALVAAMPNPQNVSAASDNVLPLAVDRIDWQPWSREAVAAARSEGRPVLVNFTADWAVTSGINESTSFDVPSVRTKLREVNAVALLADYTAMNEEIAAQLRALDQPGVPLVAVYSHDLNAAPQLLPGVLTAEIVIAALEQTTGRSLNSTAGSSEGITADHDRNKVPSILLEGKRLHESGKLAEAEAKWKEALRLDPQNPAAKHYLSLLENGRPAPATDLTHSAANQSALHTRWFKVDPNTIRQGVRHNRYPTSSPGIHEILLTNAASYSVTGTDQIIKGVRQVFTDAGVDFTVPGKQLFFNDRTGHLMVRATLQDFDIVEQVIQVISAQLPQVEIEVKFCEVSEDAIKALGFDWIFGETSALSSTNEPSDMPFTRVLTDSKYRLILEALEQRRDVKVMSLPKVTTLSGRPARLKATGIGDMVTGTEPAPAGTGSGEVIAEAVELGPVADVVAYVQPDGGSIRMALTASQHEFEGYTSPGERTLVTTSDGRKQWARTGEPKPIFRKREFVSESILGDGLTVMALGGGAQFTPHPRSMVPLLGDLPLIGRLFRSNGVEFGKSTLLVFVTATLVDPAGNRIHREEDQGR